MYFQITTRCNMSCAHCCFSCTSEGEDMSLGTFQKSLKLLAEVGDGYLTLGGGEPTVHPQFERFLFDAIGRPDNELTLIITNGKIKRRAMTLARLGQSGVIRAELSRDPYHDPISEDVISAFDTNVRDVSKGFSGPKAIGRAKKLLGLEPHEQRHWCICESWFVQPDGDVRQCGCPGSRTIGNVRDGINTQWKDTCEHSIRKIEIAEQEEREEAERHEQFYQKLTESSEKYEERLLIRMSL